MTHWNRSIRSLALLVIGSLAGSAAAQPAPAPKPTQHELDRARAHFQAAEAAKARRDYKTAAAEYLAAYALFEDPEFFFDIGEIYRLAGDEPNALTYYQQYLELDPKGRGAAAARAAVSELGRSSAAKQDEARRKADGNDAKRKTDQDAAKHATGDETRRKTDRDTAKRATGDETRRKTDENVTKRADQVAAQANPTPTDSPSSTDGRELRIAGLATGSAGVVLFGVGAVFGLRAKSISDKASSWDRFDQARYDQGQAAERNMFILTGIGATALVTGSVLYYLGHRAGTADDGGARPAVTFVPTLGHGLAAFTAVGRF